MALEDYPFRVEKMGPHDEVGHVLVYADHPLNRWRGGAKKTSAGWCVGGILAPPGSPSERVRFHWGQSKDRDRSPEIRLRT